MNRQGAKMSKVYIKCLHCGQVELTSGVQTFFGDFLCDENDAIDVKILVGICSFCQCRNINTGRTLILKNKLTGIALKDRIDN